MTKKNKNTSKHLLNFIETINGLVQLALFLGTFAYIIYLSSLPTIQHILAIVIWLIAIAPVSIIVSAIAQQQAHLREQAEYDVTQKIISVPLPPLKFYMLRSFLAWIIYVIGFILILLLTIAIISAILMIVRDFIEFIAIMIFIISFAPVTLMGVISALLFYSVPEPIIDFRLYPRSTLQKLAYKNGKNPLEWETLKPNLDLLFRGSLFLSLWLVTLLSMKFIPMLLTEIFNVTGWWSVLIILPVDAVIIFVAYRLFKILNRE